MVFESTNLIVFFSTRTTRAVQNQLLKNQRNIRFQHWTFEAVAEATFFSPVYISGRVGCQLNLDSHKVPEKKHYFIFESSF